VGVSTPTTMHIPLLALPQPVLTLVKWNVENVRGYERVGGCSFFNKVDFLLMIKKPQFI
jgi:hypothetical protein